MKNLIPVIVTALLLSHAATSFASSIAYSYDARNRLTAVNYANASVISYTYDRAHNMITCQISVDSEELGVFLFYMTHHIRRHYPAIIPYALQRIELEIQSNQPG